MGSGKLFDEKKISRISASRVRRPSRRPRPVYPVICITPRPPNTSAAPSDTRDRRDSREDELMHFCAARLGLSVTNFELVRAAHDLRQALLKTAPTKRGRGSG